MNITISIAAGSDQESSELTESLADWLAEDSAVARNAEIRPVRSQPVAGSMSGGAIDWINLVLGDGFQTAFLVYAHKSWRAALPPRQRSANVSIEWHGARVVLHGASVQDAAEITRLLAGGADSSSIPQGNDDGATRSTSSDAD